MLQNFDRLEKNHFQKFFLLNGLFKINEVIYKFDQSFQDHND
jgi:hypothetical protein